VSEVSLAIGGRTYKVACAPGEEAHVTRLGAAIDAKLRSMAQLSPQEAQNLLFAALLLADELHDLRNAHTAAQGDAAEAREALAPAQAELARLKEQAAELTSRAASAQQHQRALEAVRAEVEELRQAEADMGAALQASQAAEEDLREQLDALIAEQDSLRRELEEARTAPAPALPLESPDLAPALEQFAELLESCADKLEGRAPSA
jgi:cell division protein ZapA